MTVIGIVAGILILSLLMILHELGHFLVGRALGFKIEQFSLFMGPVLFERVGKDGVRYNIKAFPIGASVSFAGDTAPLEGNDGVASDPEDPGLFYRRPRWARALVIAAGPAVNFLSAIVAFALLFSLGGVVVPILGDIQPGTEFAANGLQAGDRLVRINDTAIRTQLDLSLIELTRVDQDPLSIVYVRDKRQQEVHIEPEIMGYRQMLGINYLASADQPRRITYVDPRSNEGQPALLEGDILISLNGIDFSEDEAIARALAEAEGAIEVLVQRDGEELLITMTPVTLAVYRPLGLLLTETRSLGSALVQSLHYPWSIVKSSLGGLAMMISGQLSARDNLTGPVGIVVMVGDVVKSEGQTLADKLGQLLFLFALISVAIGFTNLLPLPALDGSQLVILGVEGVARRDLPEKLKLGITYVGFFLIIGLALLVLYLDIARLIA